MATPSRTTDAPPRFAAIIVAAGSGSRAGRAIPKQYVRWRGKPVLRHSDGANHVIDEVVLQWSAERARGLRLAEQRDEQHDGLSEADA